MSKTSIISEHIEITPGICSGKPRISGHRIKVRDIVIWHEMMGLSADEIIYHYPSITLADVYAALAYYYDNLDEIRQDIRDSDTFVRDLAAKTPSILKRKLKEHNVEQD
jgi:uncharacterized protein (DUF433 family)